MSIVFKKVIDETFVSVKFTEVKIELLDILNVRGEEALVINNLYRGRVEFKDRLIEVSEDGKGYFYLEFIEGRKMEFWAKSIGIDEDIKMINE